jgi:hypothetical protein
MNNTYETIINEIPLCQEELADVRQLYNYHAIQVARQNYIDTVFCGPFHVSIPPLGIAATQELEALIRSYWVPWQRDVHDELNQVGICPFHFKRVRGTVHWRPAVPKPGTGRITTYADPKTHEQKFRWYWQNSSEDDKTTHWITNHNAPALNGRLRSPVASLLPDYRTIVRMREDLEYASKQSTHMPYIWEYHPSKLNRGDDGLSTLEYGEGIAGMVVTQYERLKQVKARVNTDALKQSMIRQHIANGKIMPPKKGSLWTEAQADVLERGNPGLVDRSVHLPPDFRYVAAQKPTPVADLERYLRRFDALAASVMGFPLEMVRAESNVRASNAQGNVLFLNEKIKAGLAFYADVTKHALLQVYGTAIQNGLDSLVRRNLSPVDAPWKILRLYAKDVVEVQMRCTPMLSKETLQDLWTKGFMSKETCGEYMFRRLGLPVEDMEISEGVAIIPGQAKPNKRIREETCEIDQEFNKTAAEETQKKKKTSHN